MLVAGTGGTCKGPQGEQQRLGLCLRVDQDDCVCIRAVSDVGRGRGHWLQRKVDGWECEAGLCVWRGAQELALVGMIKGMGDGC